MDGDSKNSITFVLPALNEEILLPITAGIARSAAEELGLPFEIIIVDDGSSDNTYQIALNIENNDARVRVIRHKTNLGLGAAYKTGIQNSRMESLMLLPADDAWPKKSIIEILSKINSADIVIPYIKVAGDKTLVRKFLSNAYTKLINLIFNLNVPYYNGVCLHKIALLRSIRINANDFSYQTEVLVKLLSGGATFVTVESNTNNRVEGKSKALRPKNIINVLHSILKLRIEVSSKDFDRIKND